MTGAEFFGIATTLTILLCLLEWVKRRWGDWTLGCIIGSHKGCDQHLSCACPHHDEVIHEELERVT